MQATQDPNAEGQISESDNLSQEGLLALLQGESKTEEQTEEQAEAQAEEETEETETEEATEESTEDAEETDEEEETKESSSEIDLLSLSPEQIQDLAKKGKSRLLERIGELTAKNKAAEAKLAEIESKSGVREIPQEQNPFANLDTADSVQAKYKEFENTLEATDKLLEEYEDYGAEDVITVGNQEFTKRQLRLANRNAREAITKFLPAQAAHLQKLASFTEAEKHWVAEAKKEVPEINDEESPVGKAYAQLLADPLVAKLKKQLPEIGCQIEYLLAHAANSKFGKPKSVPQGAGKNVKLKPAASPVGSNAVQKKTSQASKYQEAMKRFEESGDPQDWVVAQRYK
jgi:hypothetical protein